MNLRALFGWGIGMYAILYLVWSILIIHGFATSFLANVVVLGVLILVAAYATKSLRLFSERDVLPYAIGWVVIAVCLDALVAVPTAGWGMYTDWNVWVGYVLLLAIPLVVTALTAKRA